jgi:hypothetical protein
MLYTSLTIYGTANTVRIFWGKHKYQLVSRDLHPACCHKCKVGKKYKAAALAHTFVRCRLL